MAETLDTYIKSPAPPKDPDAQYVYNEQQFSKLEGALRKHHDKILETSENSQALYEYEVKARADADSAIVETIETLRASVDATDASTQAQIQNIQTAQADADSATASKLTTLEAKVDSGDSQNLALIRDEAKTRATKVDALASKVSALSASVKVGQNESRALVKQETLARADAVSAEALARTSLQSYVGWDGGSYSSNLTQTMNTKVSKTDGASYEWSVQGTIDGSTGGLRLQGAKRLNPSTGLLETTANLIIDANTTINGSLIVGNSISTDKIADGAITALKMPDSVITNTKIADGAITTGKIAANAITANQISAGTITADRLVVGGLDYNQIRAGGLSDANVSAGSGGAATSVQGHAGGKLIAVATYDGTTSAPAIGSMSLWINGSQVAYIALNGVPDGSGTQYGSTGGFLYGGNAPGDDRVYSPFLAFAPSGNRIMLPASLSWSSYCIEGTNTATAYCTVAGTLRVSLMVVYR